MEFPNGPGIIPGWPGIIPVWPGIIPDRPGIIPEWPGIIPDWPGIIQKLTCGGTYNILNTQKRTSHYESTGRGEGQGTLKGHRTEGTDPLRDNW